MTYNPRLSDEVLTEAFLRQCYLEERQSAHSIGGELGIDAVTVRNYLRKHHIPLRTLAAAVHTPADYTGFDNLSDDWHAYWIGFLAAGGCVFVNEKENHARVILTMKDSDIEHIRNFQQGIKTTARVTIAAHPAGRNALNKIAKLQVSNPYLIRALAKRGIVPNKTLLLDWPTHFPPALIPAYIRGYFDGDETVYLRYHSRPGGRFPETVYLRYHSRPGGQFPETVCRFISGSIPFLEKVRQELYKRNVKTRSIYCNQQSNAFVLPVSSRRENLLVISDMLYHNCTVCLERKRVISQGYALNGDVSCRTSTRRCQSQVQSGLVGDKHQMKTGCLSIDVSLLKGSVSDTK